MSNIHSGVRSMIYMTLYDYNYWWRWCSIWSIQLIRIHNRAMKKKWEMKKWRENGFCWVVTNRSTNEWFFLAQSSESGARSLPRKWKNACTRGSTIYVNRLKKSKNITKQEIARGYRHSCPAQIESTHAASVTLFFLRGHNELIPKLYLSTIAH